MEHEDFLAWHGEVTGDYTVRSGYKLLLELEIENGENNLQPIEKN